MQAALLPALAAAVPSACHGGVASVQHTRNQAGRSRNPTPDLRPLTFSGGDIGNSKSGFNGADANNGMPQGNPDAQFAGAYVTTAGDLKAFYNLNFAPNSITEILLFLDLNETGGGSALNSLDL